MKKILLFFIVLLFASAWATFDGPDPVSVLREKITLFNKKYARLKLDLFFNQTKYAPGDTALVRTLYVSAADLKPVNGRQLVYVDLMDQNGARVLRNQIMVVNGFASNALIIPEDLSPGIYLLVAFSDWMRNLDSSLFFQQEFIVTGKEKLASKPDAIPKLDFYPEGGSLISGVDNNLLIHIGGEYKNAKVLIKKGDEEIASLNFGSERILELKINPARNVQYIAELVVDGSIKKFDLPAAKTTGFSIEAQILEPDDAIRVKLSPSADQDWARKYFLIITNSKGIAWSRPLEFSDSNNSGGKREPVEIALPGELPGGIAQVIVVDDNLKVWLQRLIMVPEKLDLAVKIKSPKKVFATREFGRVEIEVLDRSGNPVQGRFAARITNQDLFKDTVAASSSWNNLLLYSDISPTFKMEGIADMKKINRYLIAQNGPWVNWEKISFVSEATKPKYLPQVNMVLSGKAISIESGKPLPDSSRIMFFLQKQVSGYEIATDPSGNFSCPILFDFYGKDDVFFAASHKGNDLYNISLQLDKQDSVQGRNARPWINVKGEDDYGVYRFEKNIVDKSFSYFTSNREKRDSISDPNAAIEDELQGADLELLVNDFIIFPTMEDLIREVLRSVDYRKVRGRDVVRIYTTHKHPTNSTGPLFVIDGVMTKNATSFLRLKPSETISIKVVKEGNKLARFGTLGANGVILVWTKNSNRKSKILQDNTFPLMGISPQVSSKPRGEIPVSMRSLSTPILKSCLLWAPNQILDPSGKGTLDITTTDDVGNFKIHIEGITDSGKPFSADETFQVKYNQQ